ncbi:MAG: GNAT family N-acetyltransferase [Candidatus Bathyarchaeota archaeon]|nr:GNAT family N-acetyltransferase [Candidatus Bathyarchaeota archaeon A05DMB-3]MDH7607686.1 GNAT family N-acetyltransferase [Candidatus Bathyarchaeota archaeon]
MGFHIRGFHDGDLPRLVELLNGVYRNSYEFVPFTEEKLRLEIVERKLRVLVAEEKGVVFSCVAYGRSPWGMEIEWLAASEETIRDALVEEVEKNVEDEVFTTVDFGSPMMNFWVRHGYKAEGGLYQMVARLDGVKPLPEVPAGTVIRSLKPGEEKLLIETVNSAYGWERMRDGSVARWKTEHPPFNEEWIHVAEIGEKIVSAVVSRPDTEYNEFFKAKRGYLGPAATLPDYRGKNLASALTRRAMNFFYEKGMDSVALYTVEQNTPSVMLLRKLGFEVGHHWRFMRKTLMKKG